MIRNSLFFLLAALAAACAAEQDLGSRGNGTSSALSLGDACACDYAEGCCATGLVCDECEELPMGALSCSIKNGVPDRKCRRPRAEGTLCERNEQCGSKTCGPGPYAEDPRLVCVSASSKGLAPGRCRESLDCPKGNVCVDSNCKKARGEPCDASNECASNKCYGTSPLDYACL